MPRALLAVLLAAAACGPARDPSFHRIIELSAIDELAVADAYVYYREGQKLNRVVKAGGTDPELLLQAGVVAFAATSGHAYAATNVGVFHFPISTGMVVGPSEQLSQAPALAVAADASGVVWVSCTTITFAALDGSNARSIAAPGACANESTRLTVDSSTAYGVSNAGLWVASRSGLLPAKSFSSTGCDHLAAAGGWLYCSSMAHGLVRVDPLTQASEPVLDGQVRAFALNDDRVYAAIGEDLVSSPRNTRRQDVLGTYASISALGVDASALYLVNTEGALGVMLRTSL